MNKIDLSKFSYPLIKIKRNRIIEIFKLENKNIKYANENKLKIKKFLEKYNCDIDLNNVNINMILNYINDYNNLPLTINVDLDIIKNDKINKSKGIKKYKNAKNYTKINKYKNNILDYFKIKKQLNYEELVEIINILIQYKIKLPKLIKDEITNWNIFENKIKNLYKSIKNEKLIDKYLLESKSLKILPTNYNLLNNMKLEFNKFKDFYSKIKNNQYKITYLNIDLAYKIIIDKNINDPEFINYKQEIIFIKSIIDTSNILYNKIKLNRMNYDYISQINNIINKYKKLKNKIFIGKIMKLENFKNSFLLNYNNLKMLQEDYKSYNNRNEYINLLTYFEYNYDKNIIKFIKKKIKLIDDYNFIINSKDDKNSYIKCLNLYYSNKKLFKYNTIIKKIIDNIEENKQDILLNFTNSISIYDILDDWSKIDNLFNIKCIKHMVNKEIDSFLIIKLEHFNKLFEHFNNLGDNYEIMNEIKILATIVKNGIINSKLKNIIKSWKFKLQINYNVYLYLKYYYDNFTFFDIENLNFYEKLDLLDFNCILGNKKIIYKEYINLFKSALANEKKKIIEFYRIYNGINYIINENNNVFYNNNFNIHFEKLKQILNIINIYNNVYDSENYKLFIEFKNNLLNILNYKKEHEINNSQFFQNYIDLNLNFSFILDYKNIKNYYNYFNFKTFKEFNSLISKFFKFHGELEEYIIDYNKKEILTDSDIINLFYKYIILKSFLIKNALFEYLDGYFKDYFRILCVDNNKISYFEVKYFIHKIDFSHNYFINLKKLFNLYKIYIINLKALVNEYNPSFVKNKIYLNYWINNIDKNNLSNYIENLNPKIKKIRFLNINYYKNSDFNNIIDNRSINKYNIINNKLFCICRTNIYEENMIICCLCNESFHLKCIKFNPNIYEKEFECFVCEYSKIIIKEKSKISSLLYYFLKRKYYFKDLVKIFYLNDKFQNKFKDMEIDYINNLSQLYYDYKNKTKELNKDINIVLKEISLNLNLKIDINLIDKLYEKLKFYCYSYFIFPFIIENIESLYKNLKIVYIIRNKILKKIS